MSKRPFIEMNLLSSAKETENKLRWDATVDEVTFSLYIPKWRIPNPWPARIGVSIGARRAGGDDLPNLTPAHVQADATLTLEPIIATVEWKEDKTKTARFRPVGNSKLWEIGEPYIPFPLIPEESDRLRLIIVWDLGTRGGFTQGRFQLLTQSGW